MPPAQNPAEGNARPAAPSTSSRLEASIKTKTKTTTTDLEDGTRIVETETIETHPDGSTTKKTKKESTLELTTVVLGRKRTVEKRFAKRVVETTTTVEREITLPDSEDEELLFSSGMPQNGGKVEEVEARDKVNGLKLDQEETSEYCGQEDSGATRGAVDNASDLNESSSELDLSRPESIESVSVVQTSEQINENDDVQNVVSKEKSKQQQAVKSQNNDASHRQNAGADNTVQIEDQQLLQSLAQVATMNAQMDELRRDLDKIEKKCKHKSHENKLKMKNYEAQREIAELKQQLEIAMRELNEKSNTGEVKAAVLSVEVEGTSCSFRTEKHSDKQEKGDVTSHPHRKFFFRRDNAVHPINSKDNPSSTPDLSPGTSSRRDSFSRSRTLSPRRRLNRQRNLSPLRRSLSRGMRRRFKDVKEAKTTDNKTPRKDERGRQRDEVERVQIKSHSLSSLPTEESFEFSQSNHNIKKEAIQEETTKEVMIEMGHDSGKKENKYHRKDTHSTVDTATTNASLTDKGNDPASNTNAKNAKRGRCFYHPEVKLTKFENPGGGDKGKVEYVCPRCIGEIAVKIGTRVPGGNSNTNIHPYKVSNEGTAKEVSRLTKSHAKSALKQEKCNQICVNDSDINPASSPHSPPPIPTSSKMKKSSLSSDYFLADMALFPMESNTNSLKALRSSWPRTSSRKSSCSSHVTFSSDKGSRRRNGKREL